MVLIVLTLRIVNVAPRRMVFKLKRSMLKCGYADVAVLLPDEIVVKNDGLVH